ncbi:condensation domain-containing protein [Streptomyces sp. NPDC054829]
MTKTGPEDILPLSPLQEGLLFHALYDEAGEDVYTVQVVLDLGGDLDRAALKAAAQALLDRHANLRVGFLHPKQSPPVQVVARHVELPWSETDLRTCGERETETRLGELQAEEKAHVFDLARPPLMRYRLVRLADDAYRLLITFHHILLDGWSTSVLLGELLQAYSAGGDASGLPPVTPFRDHLAHLSRQDRPPPPQARAPPRGAGGGAPPNTPPPPPPPPRVGRGGPGAGRDRRAHPPGARRPHPRGDPPGAVRAGAVRGGDRGALGPAARPRPDLLHRRARLLGAAAVRAHRP